jgi:AraC-like DNA-binding protein
VLITCPSAPFSPWLRLAHQITWRASPHTGQGTKRRLRDWQFLLQLSGESWIWYEAAGGRWPLRPGDLAVVPPGAIYAWGVPLGSHLAVHFDLSAQPDLAALDMVDILGGPVSAAHLRTCPRFTLQFGTSQHECLAVVRPPSPRRWQERFAPLVRQWVRRDHERPEARLEAAGILASAFADWLALARPVPDRDATTRTAVGRLIDGLSSGPPPRNLDIPGLANRCGLGETAFRAAFRNLVGLTPRAWLETRRVEFAAGLLRDGGVSVTAAALAVGYPDPFHFARVFRRVTGKPPRACR